MTNRIAEQSLTGYGQSVGNVVYVGIWNQVFSTQAPMRFLPGNYGDIVDVWLTKEDVLVIGSYPFTASSVKDTVRKFETEVRALILQKNQFILTLRVTDDRISELRPEEFTDHYPFYTAKDELFIFTTEESNGGFPTLYFMPKSSRVGVNLNTLDVMAHCSHEAYNPAGEMTAFGKHFVYTLVQSKILNRFAPDVPPLKDVSFPTNGKDDVPESFNTTNLESLLVANGIDKFPAKTTPEITSNVPLLPAPKKTVTSLVSAELPEINDDDIDDDSLFETKVSVDVEDEIITQVLARGTINLTEVLELGVSETLRLVGDTNFVVDIVLNIQDTARKMCIWAKQIWVLPLKDDDFDPEESFGESSEFFVVCNETSFPTNTKTA